MVVGHRESFGLLGPNGAGKTTALRMMQGQLEPSSGSVRICGVDPAEQPRNAALLAGICPQHDTLWGPLSAREHLLCYARIKGLMKGGEDETDDLATAVEAALVAVQLAGAVADAPCSTYSGGMRRRLSFALALVASPAVLYLDEPSTGLDPASRRMLWQAVQSARARCAIVLTTHSMEEAERLSDRVGMFVGGRLRCVGSPQR
ncbi:hypothetical protein FOA52_003915 [Chlamydomonas sp. UWO 241]|nr:hypothetical protein FOA52_003915 [Chlamydomonas sp. UWO 241]